ASAQGQVPRRRASNATQANRVAAKTPPAKPTTAPPTANPLPPPQQSEDDRRRLMMGRSIALLQKSAATFGKLSGPTCGACHHQLLPVLALSVAHAHGLRVDETHARERRQ